MKFFSLILCFSIPGTAFVTLCPGSEGHSPEVHLITKLCDKHACNRTEPPPLQACSDDDRSHQACDDRPMIDEYVPVQQELLSALSASLPVVVGNLFQVSHMTAVAYPTQAASFPSPQRTPVLRI